MRHKKKKRKNPTHNYEWDNLKKKANKKGSSLKLYNGEYVVTNKENKKFVATTVHGAYKFATAIN